MAIPGQSAFGPGQNDKRFTNINPVAPASNGLRPAQQMTQQATVQAQKPVTQNFDAARGYVAKAATNAPKPAQQFGAVAATNTQPAAAQYGQATQQAAQYGAPAADTTAARAGITSRLNDMTNAPNRVAQAQDAFKLVRESGQGDYDAAVRDVGRDAAKFGRIGAGMTSSKVGDLFGQRQSSLDRTAAELSQNAAALQRQDQSEMLNSTRAAAGDLFGQDMATGQQGLQRADFTAGMGDRSLNMAGIERGDATEERGFAAGRDDTGADRSMSIAQLMSSLGGQEGGFAQSEAGFNAGRQDAGVDALFRGGSQMAGFEGQGDAMNRADRQEFRGERTYQNEMEGQAFNRDMQRRQMEEDLFNSQFAREQTVRQMLANLGQGG